MKKFYPDQMMLSLKNFFATGFDFIRKIFKHVFSLVVRQKHDTDIDFIHPKQDGRVKKWFASISHFFQRMLQRIFSFFSRLKNIIPNFFSLVASLFKRRVPQMKKLPVKEKEVDHSKMNFRDILSLSTRTFKTRPLRTSLTILGMSVGIGAVLFLVSLGYGLQETVLHRITTTDALLSLDVSPGESNLIKLDNANLEKIKQLSHVEEVSPVSAIASQITLKDLTGVVTLYSVKPSFFSLSGLVPFKGKVFTSDTSGKSPHEIIVSSAFATIFNIPPDNIAGEKVIVTAFVPMVADDGTESVQTIELSEPFTIVGVIQDDKESFIYAPQDLLADLKLDTYVGAKIKVSAAEFMGPLRDEIISMGFFVSVLQDTIDQVKKIFSIIQVVLGLFGLVALIVSAIGMFNTMTVLLLERINEIGIMRSIGVTRSDVRKLFMFEAMIMGFFGGLGGVVLGYLVGVLANLGVNLLAKNFGGQALDLFSRPISFIILIIIFSTVIGFATGVFPALRAAKIKPLDALRYK